MNRMAKMALAPLWTAVTCRTLGLARKLYSHLMECLVENVSTFNTAQKHKISGRKDEAISNSLSRKHHLSSNLCNAADAIVSCQTTRPRLC